MLRNAAFALLAALALGGCDLPSTLERSFGDDDNPPADRSCEGVLCGPCPPAITVRVTGASGTPTPDATLSGIDASCGADGSVTVCSTHVHAPGDYTFEVRAPGYRTVALEVTVPEVLVVGACCNCGYDARVVDVTLERQ
ncbi:hypothetical protein JY651_18705 [Pyxidicoccus parkwayensis]|uniref:Carboxypeptidase regulatory-like domain-containing protein n=1 Tax=Pyxidicoccus parkwayensis TaxID=2813578 RepID=A0ABX7P8Q1_9BACT|nr:hypothetical protein [Pyxidicoccus parkwaysis]QSQ26819.1 hypothetical protein JY651_18705 [Pyxidicoccus parkwaysis]